MLAGMALLNGLSLSSGPILRRIFAGMYPYPYTNWLMPMSEKCRRCRTPEVMSMLLLTFDNRMVSTRSRQIFASRRAHVGRSQNRVTSSGEIAYEQVGARASSELFCCVFVCDINALGFNREHQAFSVIFSF